MLIVGIDFSISCPAFCIINETDIVKIGCVTRGDRTEESLKKNKNKPYYILDEENGDLFNLYFIQKEKMPTDYTERERRKIDYFLDIVDNFWELVYNEIMNKEDVHVIMEGLSFGSTGNALIDISMITALLRERIVNTVGTDNFHVISPMTLKKYAKKGNSKKDELYESLIESEHTGTNMERFKKILDDNKGEWITPSKSVNKPIDDIVDAIWASLYLKDNITERV